MRAQIRLCAAMWLAMALTACAALQPPVEPETVEERIAYAQGTVTALTKTTTAALRRGSITPDEVASALHELERADGLLDDARELLSLGDIREAETQAEVAASLLVALERWLAREVGDE